MYNLLFSFFCFKQKFCLKYKVCYFFFFLNEAKLYNNCLNVFFFFKTFLFSFKKEISSQKKKKKCHMIKSSLIYIYIHYFKNFIGLYLNLHYKYLIYLLLTCFQILAYGRIIIHHSKFFLNIHIVVQVVGHLKY